MPVSEMTYTVSSGTIPYLYASVLRSQYFNAIGWVTGGHVASRPNLE